MSERLLVTFNAGSSTVKIGLFALTEAGQKTAAELDAVWNDVEEELLDKLDGKERKQLRKLLRKAAKGLSKAGADHDDPEIDGEEADSDA